MVKQLLTRISFIGLTSILLITPFSTRDSWAKFTDVTSAAGLGKAGPSYGNPIWGDFNNDGNLDIVIPRHGTKPSLYQNNGAGQFIDVFSLSGITHSVKMDRHGWAWGDYDNDGNLDLSITLGACRNTCSDKTDQLWKGTGSGFFTNIAGVAGVENLSNPGRCNFWVDYNNDGLLDHFVLNIRTSSILFKNNGNGTFTDVTLESNLANISGANCSWADYNNDGATDLLVTGDGPDRLFKNNPITHIFTDVTLQVGLLQKRGNGIALGDYNNDGYMDLYISRGDDYLRNSLIWSSSQIIFGDEENWDDGVDFSTTDSNVTFNLYIDNKYQASQIFIGGGKVNPLSIPFTLSASDPLLEGVPFYTAGKDIGIFIWKDASGILHIRYSSNNKFHTYYGVVTSDGNFTMVTSTFKPVNFNIKDTLYRNNGDGTFTNVTEISGVGKLGNHSTSVWGDYNNDGFIDLYLVENGDVSGSRPNVLFKNKGDGTFIDVTINQGVDASTIPGRKYGAAWGDYNNDGFLDLFVKNSLRRDYPRTMGRDILYRNNRNTNHWLKINLVGTTSNKLGIGAKLILVTTGNMQYRELNGGGGGELRSQGSGPVHFGIGTATIIDSLSIKWPSGIIQTLTNISADQTITVTEN